MEKDGALFFEPENAYSERVQLYHNRAGGLTIEIESVVAVGSYNEDRTTQAFLSKEEAEEMRDWLIRLLPPQTDQD